MCGLATEHYCEILFSLLMQTTLEWPEHKVMALITFYLESKSDYINEFANLEYST